MSITRHFPLPVLLLLGLPALPALAGAQGPQAPDSTAAQFKTQVIGLRTMTVAALNDSLVNRFGASEGLDSHSCGANLAQLGFPRTSAIFYKDSSGDYRFVVAVVEPADSARVRHNEVPDTSPPLPASWGGDSVLQQFLDPTGKWILSNQFNAMVATYPMFTRGQVDSARARVARSKATAQHEVLWTFLKEHSAADDRAAALQVLSNDSSYRHRMLAVAILSTASDDPAIWHTMMHTIRDPSDNVAMLAGGILRRWALANPHPVDWSPVADDLRVLLAGGNLWVLPQVMEILVKTDVSPSLAKQLLADNGTFVVGYAGTHGIDRYAKAAQDLLARLSGHTYGADVTQWNAWIAAL